MYRHDYSLTNPSPITNSSRLYDANYYVMNSEFKVYVCIDNGSSGINTTGNASLDEPTFTDLGRPRQVLVEMVIFGNIFLQLLLAILSSLTQQTSLLLIITGQLQQMHRLLLFVRMATLMLMIIRLRKYTLITKVLVMQTV